MIFFVIILSITLCNYIKIKPSNYYTQNGRAVRALDFQFGGVKFKSALTTLAGFVHGSPEFKSSTTLVNRKLVCLKPFGILNPVMFVLNYLFQSLGRVH